MANPLQLTTRVIVPSRAALVPRVELANSTGTKDETKNMIVNYLSIRNPELFLPKSWSAKLETSLFRRFPQYSACPCVNLSLVHERMAKRGADSE
jgi:hypothetical protein